MMMTVLRCLWRNHYFDDFFNAKNRSQTPPIDHKRLKIAANKNRLQYSLPTSMSPNFIVLHTRCQKVGVFLLRRQSLSFVSSPTVTF